MSNSKTAQVRPYRDRRAFEPEMSNGWAARRGGSPPRRLRDAWNRISPSARGPQ